MWGTVPNFEQIEISDIYFSKFHEISGYFEFSMSYMMPMKQEKNISSTNEML